MGNKPVTYNFDGRPMVELSEHADLDIKLEIAIAALQYIERKVEPVNAVVELGECVTVASQALNKICPSLGEVVRATNGKRILVVKPTPERET